MCRQVSRWSSGGGIRGGQAHSWEQTEMTWQEDGRQCFPGPQGKRSYLVIKITREQCYKRVGHSTYKYGLTWQTLGRRTSVLYCSKWLWMGNRWWGNQTDKRVIGGHAQWNTHTERQTRHKGRGRWQEKHWTVRLQTASTWLGLIRWPDAQRPNEW